MPHKRRKSYSYVKYCISTIDELIRSPWDMSTVFSAMTSSIGYSFPSTDNHQDELKRNIDAAIKDLERLSGGSHAS